MPTNCNTSTILSLAFVWMCLDCQLKTVFLKQLYTSESYFTNNRHNTKKRRHQDSSISNFRRLDRRCTTWPWASSWNFPPSIVVHWRVFDEITMLIEDIGFCLFSINAICHFFCCHMPLQMINEKSMYSASSAFCIDKRMSLHYWFATINKHSSDTQRLEFHYFFWIKRSWIFTNCLHFRGILFLS